MAWLSVPVIYIAAAAIKVTHHCTLILCTSKSHCSFLQTLLFLLPTVNSFFAFWFLWENHRLLYLLSLTSALIRSSAYYFTVVCWISWNTLKSQVHGSVTGSQREFCCLSFSCMPQTARYYKNFVTLSCSTVCFSFCVKKEINKSIHQENFSLQLQTKTTALNPNACFWWSQCDK